MKRPVRPLEPLESDDGGYQSLDRDPYMSIRQIAHECRVSRETVSAKLAAVGAWPGGKRNGYPVYHVAHWLWASQGMHMPVGCVKCKCKRCKQLYAGKPSDR